MSRSLALPPLLALALSACAVDTYSPNVDERTQQLVNGNVGTEADIASTVGILPTGFGGLCTGTLIAPRVVLTAAHCTCANADPTCSSGRATPSSMEVVIGELDLMSVSAGAKVSITEIVAHPGYPPADGADHDDDIALLILARDVTELPLSPLPTPEELAALQVGETVTITGYGAYDGENPRSGGTGVLHTADIPYASQSEFEFIAGERNGGGTDASTCIGDSGGPLYANLGGTRKVAGITSRAAPMSPFICGDGAVYTKVSAYLDWIFDNVPGTVGAPLDPRTSSGEDPVNPTPPPDPSPPTSPPAATGGTPSVIPDSTGAPSSPTMDLVTPANDPVVEWEGEADGAAEGEGCSMGRRASTPLSRVLGLLILGSLVWRRRLSA